METYKFLLLVKKKSHHHWQMPQFKPRFLGLKQEFLGRRQAVSCAKGETDRSQWHHCPLGNSPCHKLQFIVSELRLPFSTGEKGMQTKLLFSMGHCPSHKYYYFVLPPCTKKSPSPHKFCNMTVFLPKKKSCNNVQMVQPPTPQTPAFHQKQPLWSQVQNRLLLAISIMLLAAKTPRAAESRVGQCSLLGWGRCWGTEIIWGFLLTRASMRTSAPSSLSWRVSISVSSCSKSTTAMETCAGC